MQTILIIDDDAAIGSLEQEVLERAGYAVLRAYSGTEARLLLKNEKFPARKQKRTCNPRGFMVT